ncbi:MAG: macro domain-containing protein [bacterium]
MAPSHVVNQILVTRPLRGSRTLRLIEGDITEEESDAIVNAANEMLAHGGGLAAAIVRKGGRVIQEQSSRWVAEHGPVHTGGAALTSGGDLKARYVIHAVGPIWSGGSRKEEHLLHSAVRTALALADEHGLRSIAIPAISTGIFGYPKRLAAPVIVGAIVDYVQEHPESGLEDIRICTMTAADAAPFKDEILKLPA